MLAQTPIDPNELIDTTGVGWEEVLLAAGALIVAVVVGAFVRRLVRSAAMRWSDTQPDFAVFLGKLAGWFVVVLGIAAALMMLGVQLGPMLLIVAVVTVILALSARDLLENFGAGVVLQSENSFRIGDLVEIADEVGTVIDITGRTTVIDTYDGRRKRVPNGQVLRSEIVNYSERGALRSEIIVGLEYGSALDEAKTLFEETAGAVDDIFDHPAPEALVVAFGDSSIDFTVRFWHDPTQQGRSVLTDRVARAIDKALREKGFVIAFPQVVVWRSGADEGQE